MRDYARQQNRLHSRRSYPVLQNNLTRNTISLILCLEYGRILDSDLNTCNLCLFDIVYR